MTDTFLNLPVRGEKIYGVSKKDQYPIEQFSPFLQVLLDDPRIFGIRFRAYTPYFNDGDPCVFSVNEPSFLLDPEIAGDIEGENDYDEGEDNYLEEYYLRPIIGSRGYNFDKNGRMTDTGYEGPDEELYNKVNNFSKALTDGHFDDVLLDAFGDHAVVTITRSGVDIEFCEHD